MVQRHDQDGGDESNGSTNETEIEAPSSSNGDEAKSDTTDPSLIAKGEVEKNTTDKASLIACRSLELDDSKGSSIEMEIRAPSFRGHDSGLSSSSILENATESDRAQRPRSLVEAKRSISERHSQRSLGGLVCSGSSFETPSDASTRPGAVAMQGAKDLAEDIQSNTGNETVQDEETPQQVLVEAEIVDPRKASTAPVVQAVPMSITRKRWIGIGVLAVALMVGVVLAIVFSTRSSANDSDPFLEVDTKSNTTSPTSAPTFFERCSGSVQSDGLCLQVCASTTAILSLHYSY